MQIETKYNIWDTVWTIIDSKGVKWKIFDIEIELLSRKNLRNIEWLEYGVKYKIIFSKEDYSKNWVNHLMELKYEKLKKTKEELLELL